MNTERTSFIAAASPGWSGDDLDRHAERAERLGERLCGRGRRRARACSIPFAGTGPSRATSANRRVADQLGELALQRRRGRVQVGVEGLARERSRARRGPPRRATVAALTLSTTSAAGDRRRCIVRAAGHRGS